MEMKGRMLHCPLLLNGCFSYENRTFWELSKSTVFMNQYYPKTPFRFERWSVWKLVLNWMTEFMLIEGYTGLWWDAQSFTTNVRSFVILEKRLDLPCRPWYCHGTYEYVPNMAREMWEMKNNSFTFERRENYSHNMKTSFLLTDLQ